MPLFCRTASSTTNREHFPSDLRSAEQGCDQQLSDEISQKNEIPTAGTVVKVIDRILSIETNGKRNECPEK